MMKLVLKNPALKDPEEGLNLRQENQLQLKLKNIP